MIGYRRNCAQMWWRATTLGCAALLAMAVNVSPAGALTLEIREFTVKIDKKLAGTYTMSISQGGRGWAQMEGHANVDVRFYLLGHYTYMYDGTEDWKDELLHLLKSKSDDDGTKYVVQADWQPDLPGLVVWSNGKQRVRQNNVWTTTYWRLPAQIQRQLLVKQRVNLLEVDTGNDLSGTLEYMGQQQVNVGGQLQNCDYYRLIGDKLNVKLWYDAKRRLAREESVEGSHTYVLEVKTIR
jgi:hypothetical protein